MNQFDGKSKNTEFLDNVSLEEFFEYFKDLNMDPNGTYDVDDDDDDECPFDDNTIELINIILNSEITADEIFDSIKNLKNNKASGLDDIVNEHLKATVDILLPVYVLLFNLVLDHGYIPESWMLGIIKPIYKNKGDRNDPDSYRAITLVSNLGKVFTGILNSRLNFYPMKLI